jgi:hypothetical protein
MRGTSDLALRHSPIRIRASCSRKLPADAVRLTDEKPRKLSNSAHVHYSPSALSRILNAFCTTMSKGNSKEYIWTAYSCWVGAEQIAKKRKDLMRIVDDTAFDNFRAIAGPFPLAEPPWVEVQAEFQNLQSPVTSRYCARWAQSR